MLPEACTSSSSANSTTGADREVQEKSDSAISDDERKKRPRTAFTAAQIKSLEAEFERNKYLSVAKRLQLSKTLKLTETQVRVLHKFMSVFVVNGGCNGNRSARKARFARARKIAHYIS